MFEPTEDEAYDLLPPPSYELSQEEFDHKTSQAVQASLAAVSNPNNEDEWEVWDEAAFEAAARAASSSGTSSFSSPPAAPPPRPEKAPMIEEPMVQPLRIVKRSNQLPRLYSKSDGTSGHPPYFRTSSHSVSNTPVESFRHSRSSSVISLRTTPPPSFETESPSLDGSPYEEVILRYQPGDSRPSSPLANYSVSPLRSSRSRQPQSYGPASYANSHSPPSHQSRSFSNVPQKVPPRQSNQYPPPTRHGSHPANFNPLVAYSKPLPGSEGMPTKVDAAALYNSAVSAHVPSRSPQSPVATSDRENSVYPQDFPTMAQSQTYNSLYNDVHCPGNHRSRLPSAPPELNHSTVSQPLYYSQQAFPPNHPDTRWYNYQQPLQPSR